MATLVNPATGERFEGPDDQLEDAKRETGLVTEDEYAAQQEGPLMAGARAGSAAVAAPLEMADKTLRKVGLGSYDAKSDPNASPAALEWQKQHEGSLGEFFNKAALAKEAHPLAAMAGEAIPMGITGALAGGIGAGLAGGGALGTAAGLGLESAATGMSQEAVDAITQKRDFSAKAALMNGGVNLALGGLFLGAGHALSGAAGRAGAKALGEEAAAVSGVRPTEGAPGARNWVSELDPGEVPDAVQGGRNRAPRTAESAGAAAKNFDDLDAAKAITEIKEGKVSSGPIAEAAPAIREHLSVEGARDLDFINEVLYDDAGLATKHQDFAQGASEWTPEMVEKQGAWLGDMTEKSAQAIEAIRAIPDAKGLGRAAEEAIQKGLRRINMAEGADLNVGLDAFKRSGDSIIARIGSATNSTIDQETRQAVMNQVRSVTDSLREGMLDEGMFGRNARVQAAHNEPLHEMIGALGRVQKKLYETTGRTWGETGVGAIERRADPDALRKLFEDPHLGGKLFKQDLAHVLDQAETLGRNRLEHGMTQLDRLPEFVEKLQGLRDDLNTAEVLHAAERQAGGGAHGAGGASAGGAIGANLLVHAAEYGGRSVGFPLGNIVRSTGAYAQTAHAIDRLVAKFGGGELAKSGTATRNLLDRYASRVKGSELLGDAAHRAKLPENLTRFLDQAHAPPIRPSLPPMPPGSGTGTPGTPQAPPGSPANDVRGKVAGVAALAGGGALLASGQASAAMLPEDQQARDQLTQQLQGLSPEEQQARIQTAESFARIQQKTTQRVNGAVKDLFALARDPNAQPRYRSPKARELDQRSQELDVPRHLARFMGKQDDPVDAFSEKSGLIQDVVAHPEKLARHMAENLGDLPTEQPEIFASMVGQTMSTIQYLHERMPGVAGKSALDPEGYPPTFEEISEWAGHWVGAIHPLDSLDDLASNELVPEQIEAVQSLWPEGYQMFQTAAMGQIHQLSLKPGGISREALEQIDSALNLDGAGEPTLSSDFAGLLRKAEKADAQRLQAEASKPQPPMQSQSPQRLASSALGSLHAE